MARRKIKKVEVVEKKFDGGGAKRKAINTYQDVADSEDDFEAAQDKILLDGVARDSRFTRDDVEASDEEVLALPDEEYSDELEEASDAEEEIEEGWGDRKGEYYNADDGSDEEDQQAEEEEAMRIQKRNLAKLSDADYTEDVNNWRDVKEEETSTVEVLPTTISADLPKPELLRILELRNPEFTPFATEFKTLHEQYFHLEQLSSRKHHPQHAILLAKFNALRSYLAVLSFYFALISSKPKQANKIREHEIMISLIRCREAWNRMNSVEIDENQSDIISQPAITLPAAPTKKRKRSKKVIAPVVESYAPDSDDELEETFRALKALPKRKRAQKTSDLADTAIDVIDAEESAARRKSLQFHASRVHKSTAKKQYIQSGDQDLPYRERKKEREIRMQAEAEKQRGGTFGDDLDDEPVQAPSDRGESEDEYYQLIKSASTQEKERKKKDHDDAVALIRAERSGFAVPEELTGKRGIDRTIEKNKGITTKKPKENRNARVKKRNKYEAAKKKLGSQKAIYKQQVGSYSGELTGINPNLVKSVRLDQGQSKKR